MKDQNQKAVEARERKQIIKTEKEMKKREEAENMKWIDEDKHVNNKLQRKAETLQKQEDKMQKKEELRKLVQEEEASMGSGKKKIGGVQKITRAELMQRALLANRKKVEEEPVQTWDTMEEGNVNHMIREWRFENAKEQKLVFEATGVDEAVSLFSAENNEVDRHPEKRMRAAYKAYEDQQLPRLREEYPSLKRSQLLLMIEKQWKKAPENPLVKQQMMQQNMLLNSQG